MKYDGEDSADTSCGEFLEVPSLQYEYFDGLDRRPVLKFADFSQGKELPAPIAEAHPRTDGEAGVDLALVDLAPVAA